MRSFALLIAALIFTAVGSLHLYRYMYKLNMIFGEFSVPMDWSLYATIVLFILAIWMFISRRGA